VCKRFERELAAARKALSGEKQMMPSQRLMAEEVIVWIGADIQAIGQVVAASERRIFQKEKCPSGEKIVSIERRGCGLHRLGCQSRRKTLPLLNSG